MFSRSIIQLAKKINKIFISKYVCIAFQKNNYKNSLNLKSFIEKSEDIELLRFLDLNIKLNYVNFINYCSRCTDLIKVENKLKGK